MSLIGLPRPAGRLPGRSYLTHLGRVAGLGRRELASSIDEVSGRQGLNPGLDVALDTLSRGNLHNVPLTQCLIRPVALMALDEPFTALDTAAKLALIDLIGERLKVGVGFLIATHSTGLPGTTWVLNSGRVTEDGPAEPGGEVFLVELTGPDRYGDGVPLPGGGTRHRLPAGELEACLQRAISDGARVRRVEPEADR